MTDLVKEENENERQLKSAGKLLVKLCCAIYFVSYITRLDFSATMAEIIQEGVLSESSAGLIGTILFIAYGSGQIVSGILGDRISPGLLIVIGLSVASFVNFIFPCFGKVEVLCVVWGNNGFAQAMLWPPMVKLLARYLKGDAYSKGTFWVISASQIATIAIYLIVPLCIRWLGWQSVFIIAGSLAAVVCVLCVFGFRKIALKDVILVQDGQAETVSDCENKISFRCFFISSGLFLIVVAIIMQGILRDGIMSWMPTFLNEVFHLSTETAILSNVLLPIFSIGCVYLSGVLYRKAFKNEVNEAIFFFSIAFVACLILCLFHHAVVSIICAAVISGCMHAVNLMLVSYVPVRFKKYGKVSLVSGMTNAFTYVGSAVSSFGFAVVATAYGWSVLTYVWLGICIIALILLGCSAYFLKTMNRDNKFK